MNVRKFNLINDNGERYELTIRSHFLHSPSGLGFAKDTSYQRVGYLYKPLKNVYAQGEVSGDIFFPDPNAYDKYTEFIKFVGGGGLYLLYTPTKKEYRCRVHLTQIEKTEKQACGLNCPVVLTQETMWYNTVAEFNDGSLADSGKKYDYQYDYRYADYLSNTVAFNSDSVVDSPMRIYIYGHAVNPTWRVYHNNVLIGTGSVQGEIPDGNMLLIDTMSVPYQIKQLDAFENVVSDMYAFSNFSTQRFFYAKNGVNRISAAHEGTTPLKVRVEAQLLYASV